VLLVHGTGQNAAAWDDVAPLLTDRAHPVAVDLRGHGQSSGRSEDAEQYWRDLRLVTASLGWARPLLVGHSTGGYAVTAAAASRGVDPIAVCVVDGFVLDDRETSAALHTAMRQQSALQDLERAFGYGWTGTDREHLDFVNRCVRGMADDPLSAGARPGLVEVVTQRSFTRVDERWVRRPVVDELVTVCSPDPASDIFPSIEVYDRLTCAATFILASRGLYAGRGEQVANVVAAGPGRRLIELDAPHNVPMTEPRALARIILHHLPPHP
jgi:pimeloyl-ACP methyl ester carboxylesterase